ncbi:uncharacterized protein C8Q71DRAFT_911026 [Rhodofomes roseus]|uniref:Fungal-type protein kinase domain-containing protein n=1 Tax=Rhodofomes roseus TaxID=34475 RepID=A0ABQ8K2R9_9APHY|nr:uncharacterized protein C8Q71DRAFT_911026 [Rhodofomes roseus]KAH9831025.1 hypothetical protein C8Q71DRAFT_911026 [Rhodofomes roseus]
MDAPQVQCGPFPLAGIWPQLSLRAEPPHHPRAFVIVQDRSLELSSLRLFARSTMGSKQSESALPRTPSKGKEKQTEPETQITATPARGSPYHVLQTATRPGNKILSDDHQHYIQGAYKDYTHWDVDVEDFVRAVFGCQWTDIEALREPYRDPSNTKDIPPEKYFISKVELKKYWEGNERNGYEPFARAGDALLEELYGPHSTGKAPDESLVARRQALQRRWANNSSRNGQVMRPWPARFEIRDVKAVGNFGIDEKPDLAYSTTAGRPFWEWELVPMEFKMEGKTGAKRKEIIDSLSDILLRWDEKQKTFVVEMPDRRGQAKGKSSKAARDDDADYVPGKQPTQTKKKGQSSTSSSSKRKREAEEALNTKSKRSKNQPDSESPSAASEGSKIIGKQAQVLRYMNQVMSHNVRSYTIAWLVDSGTLRLVYGDRMGIIFTKPIDFLDKDASLLLLILAAMGTADVHDLGIHPCVHYPKDAHGHDQFCLDNGYRGSKLRLAVELDEGTAVDVEFNFDVSESNMRDMHRAKKEKKKTATSGAQRASRGASETVEGALEDSESSQRRTIYTEFGMIGRGTTVIPVVAAPGTKTEELFGSEALVAKVAWPHAVRKAEDAMIKAVRRRLADSKPNYLKHIVDLKCSMTKSGDSEEMHLPRFKLGIVPGADELRVCRILVLKEYEPLETIGSGENFRIVFIDVVRAHHWVYETSKILHRDISLNNIMWYRLPDGRIIGVLCDWDLAEDQSTGDNRPTRRAGDAAAVIWPPEPEPAAQSTTKPSLPSIAEGEATEQPQNLEGAGPSNTQTESQPVVKPRYRTGTGPFMALDLLRRGDPPVHKYRHDLESFLYGYVYFAATYNPEEQAFGYIKEWQCASLVEIGHNKHDFLLDEKVRIGVMKAAHDTLKPLLAGDEAPLMELLYRFCEIETDWHNITTLGLSRKLSARNRAKIEEIEKEREAKMSFSIFMELLGVPEEEGV